MNYPYPITPYIQTVMAQAMQAMMSGGPLPSNCFIVNVPFEQMFPQIMMTYPYGNVGGAMMPPQQPSYYGQLYQPQLGPYQALQPTNALVPYSNYYPQGYYPIVPYSGCKKKTRRGKKNPPTPYPNVYLSSSFDSDMDNLSWSRLFGRKHSKQQNQEKPSLSYDQKPNKRRVHSSDSFTPTTTSSPTSDESIRRVNVSTKQSSGSSSSKQQTKSSLPFKYSSEFLPGLAKQQQKSDKKIRSDDVFIVNKTEQSQPSSQQ